MSIDQNHFVFVNGRYVKGSKASISVFDRGFLLGDAIFETIRIYNSVPFMLKEHERRLFDSAHALRMPMLHHDYVLKEIIRTLLKKNKLKDAAVRITFSRGAYEGGLKANPEAKPTVVAFMWDFKGYESKLHEEGASITITDVPPFSPAVKGIRVKSVNYLNNIVAQHCAELKNAHEGIMVTGDGSIAEGSTSNIFFLTGNTLKTPSKECGILPGITRDNVIALAKKRGIKVAEGKYTAKELMQSSEIFITSSLREIIPVVAIDGRKVGHGRPGDITMELLDDYRDLVEEAVREDRNE